MAHLSNWLVSFYEGEGRQDIIVRPPPEVLDAPSGSCPWPAHLSGCRCLHTQKVWWKSLYRYYRLRLKSVEWITHIFWGSCNTLSTFRAVDCPWFGAVCGKNQIYLIFLVASVHEKSPVIQTWMLSSDVCMMPGTTQIWAIAVFWAQHHVADNHRIKYWRCEHRQDQKY